MIPRIVKLCVSVVIWIADRVRLAFYRFIDKPLIPRCTVLYYHSVDTKQRLKFAWQMDAILRHANPVGADFDDPIGDKRDYVSVTFDDGFVCVIENAVPELTVRNMPYAIFVPTEYIGKKPGWIKKAASMAYDESVMNEDQMRVVSRSKLAIIGSHCVSHSNLKYADDESAHTEIVKSKEIIEGIIGKRVGLLSFPHGGYTEGCLEIARQAGYQRVFSIQPANALLGTDQFVIGRVATNPADWKLEFLLKITGAYRWLPIAYSIKKRVLSLWK